MIGSMSDDHQAILPDMYSLAEERSGSYSGVELERSDPESWSKSMINQEYREEASDHWELCYAGYKKRKRIKRLKEKIRILDDDVSVRLFHDHK